MNYFEKYQFATGVDLFDHINSCFVTIVSNYCVIIVYEFSLLED